MNEDKYPHLYEYERRCRRLISEASAYDYYAKFKLEIHREQLEVNSIWMERYRIGGKEKIHLFNESR
jgi:hypothetical protein